MSLNIKCWIKNKEESENKTDVARSLRERHVLFLNCILIGRNYCRGWKLDSKALEN